LDHPAAVIADEVHRCEPCSDALHVSNARPHLRLERVCVVRARELELDDARRIHVENVDLATDAAADEFAAKERHRIEQRDARQIFEGDPHGSSTSISIRASPLQLSPETVRVIAPWTTSSFTSVPLPSSN